MANQTVIIAFQKPMAKTSTKVTGDDVVVKGNVYLQIPERIITTFNIPEPDKEVDSTGFITVKDLHPN